MATQKKPSLHGLRGISQTSQTYSMDRSYYNSLRYRDTQ